MPEKAEMPEKKDAKADEKTSVIKKIVLLFQKDWKMQYLVLAPLLGLLIGLFAFGLGTCFGPVLVPIVVIAIPYYLGFKQTLKLLKIGFLSLIIGGVFMALIYGMVIYDRADMLGPGYVSSSDGVIQHASVSPLKGLPGENYNFTISLEPSKIKGMDVTVYFRVRDYLMERRSLGFTAEIVFNQTGIKANSTNYYSTIKLPGDTVYFAEYMVHYKNATEDHWAVTDYGLLVVTSTSLFTVFGSMLPMTLFNLVLFPYGMIFLLFVSVLWWLRRSRERRAEIEKDYKEMDKAAEEGKKEGEGSEFACTSCGAPVKEEDTSCPKCGAKFDGVEPKKDDAKEDKKK